MEDWYRGRIEICITLIPASAPVERLTHPREYQIRSRRFSQTDALQALQSSRTTTSHTLFPDLLSR